MTPAEDELPLIISVDDHVMEPKDLWQQQLPPSQRERGPLYDEVADFRFVTDRQSPKALAREIEETLRGQGLIS